MPFKGQRINETWEVVKKIGSGSFGEVFLGANIVDPQQASVAIKRDSTSIAPPRLDREKEIYDMLAGYKRIPEIYFYGALAGSPALVMELLGPTIKHLRAYSSRIRLSAVLKMGSQLVSIPPHP